MYMKSAVNDTGMGGFLCLTIGFIPPFLPCPKATPTAPCPVSHWHHYHYISVHFTYSVLNVMCKNAYKAGYQTDRLHY